MFAEMLLTELRAASLARLQKGLFNASFKASVPQSASFVEMLMLSRLLGMREPKI